MAWRSRLGSTFTSSRTFDSVQRIPVLSNEQLLWVRHFQSLPELVRDIDLKLSGAFQEEGFVVVAVGRGDKAALAREMHGLAAHQAVDLHVLHDPAAIPQRRACGASHRRRDRFDYLLGAGNGDSPSSFRNALCFAVDS